MLKTEFDSGNGDGVSWGGVCDTCCSETCSIYCRDHSAFLCSGCDSRIHAANGGTSRHERVFVCEACERAPSAFICKADAASLCVTCDADVHDANPLSRRHHRLPVSPISGSVHYHRASNVLGQERDEAIDEEDEVEAASWLILNPVKNNSSHKSIINDSQANEFLCGGEADAYLSLVEFKSCGENQFAEEQYNNQKQLTGFHFNGFVNHSVSVSSMEVGVVPETTASDDDSHPRPPKRTIDQIAGPPIQLSPLDREARVLRYREKKKSRKFEKTIRYASRKAYAEIRPRIQGRFAKRADADMAAEQKYSTPFTLETTGYGLVPSF